MTGSRHQDEFETDSDPPTSPTIAEIVFNPGLRRLGLARLHALARAAATVAPETVETRAPRKRKRRRAARTQIQGAPPPPPESALERHQRKCVICSHPDREEIEEAFLDWNGPRGIAYDFSIDVRGIFRHAHATGLYEIRQQNLRAALDRVLEHADEARVSADSIVRAVRAYTCLTTDNHWVEPPTNVIFSSTSAPPLVVAGPPAQNALNPPSESLIAPPHSSSADLNAQIVSTNLVGLVSRD
jgi:hypothetical protein